VSIWWSIAGVVLSIAALWWLWPLVSWNGHVRAAARKMLPRNRKFREELDRLKPTTWQWTLQQAQIVFRNGDRPVLTARVQLVGTLARGTWLWAWANQSLPVAVLDAAVEALAFGRREGFSQLTKSSFSCSAQEATALALVVAARSDAQAMYADKQQGKTVFATLHDLHRVEADGSVGL
jgi:hypothetical protein